MSRVASRSAAAWTRWRLHGPSTVIEIVAAPLELLFWLPAVPPVDGFVARTLTWLLSFEAVSCAALAAWASVEVDLTYVTAIWGFVRGVLVMTLLPPGPSGWPR